MLFMNEYEIDYAAHRFADDPILGPATSTLVNLKDAVNANSDGWPYWRSPLRAAKRLQELIQDGMRPVPTQVTPEAYKAAQTPLKSFRTRSGIDFEIVEVR